MNVPSAANESIHPANGYLSQHVTAAGRDIDRRIPALRFCTIPCSAKCLVKVYVFGKRDSLSSLTSSYFKAFFSIFIILSTQSFKFSLIKHGGISSFARGGGGMVNWTPQVDTWWNATNCLQALASCTMRIPPSRFVLTATSSGSS